MDSIDQQQDSAEALLDELRAGSVVRAGRTLGARFKLASRAARLLPPALSGSFLRFCRDERGKPSSFVAKSSLSDVFYYFPTLDWIAFNVAVRGYYEWQIVTAARALYNEGGTIVEVGANVGTETLLYSRIAGPRGRVVAFEPQPAVFPILREQLFRNGIENVRLVKKAVSDASGTVRFSVPNAGNLGTGSILHENDEGVEVEAVTLDDLHRAGELPNVSVIVLDVQGAEYAALSGASELLKAEQPAIIFELEEHLAGSEPTRLLELLERQGYRLWKFQGQGLVPRHRVTKLDGNWMALSGSEADTHRTARQVNRALHRAAFLPLIPSLNPAVI